MKILICYAYADLNKGDSAICLGMRDFVQKIYPDAELYFLNFSYESTKYGKITDRYCEGVGLNIVPRKGANSKFDIARNFFLKKEQKRIEKLIVENDYDLVLMNGGHFIYSNKKGLFSELKNDVRLNHVFAPLKAAKKVGVTVGILGQSIGPIKNDKFCIQILEDADFIFTREKKSADEVNQYFEVKKAQSFLDLAFYINVDDSDNIPKRDKVAINLRKVVASGGLEVGSDLFEVQLNKAKKLIDHVLQNSQYNVSLVSQVKGLASRSGENDVDIHQSIKDSCYSDERRVEVLHLDGSEMEIIKFYKNECAALFSTRFHGLIFAILAGIPSIGINMEGVGNKILGMYHDLSIEEFLCDLESDWTSYFDKLKSYPSSVDIVSRINLIKNQHINAFSKIVK